MKKMTPLAAVLATVLAVVAAGPSAAAPSKPGTSKTSSSSTAAASKTAPRKTTAKKRTPASRSRRRAVPPSLVWHVETLDGQVVDSNSGDIAINPASVVKVATSWWALERLGPDYRFETEFRARGEVDPQTGTLRGDLVVVGSGDPDFQAENAFLVAQALNEAGIRRVTGSLVVNRMFWTGWENGSEGVDPDPTRRGAVMAGRLRKNLDPARWDRLARSAWRIFAAKNGIPNAKAPAVKIAGGARLEDGSPEAGQVVVTHRSKALAETLRRFNAFSNNDIERVGGVIGTPAELVADLQKTLSVGGISLQTTSGLGENRLTPRQIVGLMRAFRGAASEKGRTIESLLPVAGCDQSTVTRFFPRLSTEPYATSLVGKTGTLTATDGGVSVLAGFLNTAQGELVFAVAAPHAAGRLRSARVTEERWLLELLASRGGPQPRTCFGPMAEPDDGAAVIVATAPPASAALSSAGRNTVGAHD